MQPRRQPKQPKSNIFEYLSLHGDEIVSTKCEFYCVQGRVDNTVKLSSNLIANDNVEYDYAMAA